jgi:hypothetical protein
MRDQGINMMLDNARENKTRSQKSEQTLFGLCAGVENANRELHGLFAASAYEPDDAALARNHAEWRDLVSRAAALRAETLADVRARVRALGRDFVAEVMRAADPADRPEREMLEALIRDLVEGE